jgi:hypothetical protein
MMRVLPHLILDEGGAAMTEIQTRRWRRFRDRPEMLERERELTAEITSVETQQRCLAERYTELRRELVELHGLLWAPDRDGPYRKTWRPELPGPAAIPPPVPDARPLRGRALGRAVGAALGSAGRPLTLTEIRRALHLSGYVLTSEHAGKQLGDALRYEEQRGGVRRIDRATYAVANSSFETPTALKRSQP